MKKTNLFLFFTLVLLLIFTYLFQEKKIWNSLEQEDNSSDIFNLSELEKTGKLISFEIAGITIDYKKGEYYIGAKLLSKSKVNLILDKLSSIISVRSFTDKESKQLLSPSVISTVFHQESLRSKNKTISFNFAKKSIVFKFGLLQQTSSHFYLQVDQNLHLVKAQYRDNEIYHESQARHRAYQGIISIFNLEPVDLFDETILQEGSFERLALLDCEKIKLKRSGRPAFTIDYENFRTDPPAYSGLTYKKSFFEHLKKQLLTMEGTIVPKNSKEKDRELSLKSTLSCEPSKLNVNHSEPRSLILKLWQDPKKLGIYLELENSEFYKLTNVTSSNAFFSQPQDFWDKKVNLTGPYLKLVWLKSEKKELFFNLNKSELIFYPEKSTTPKNKELDKEKVNQLFDLLFQSALFVDFNIKPPDTDPVLELKFKSKNYLVYLQNSDLIIFDPVYKLWFNHIQQASKLELDFMEYFL